MGVSLRRRTGMDEQERLRIRNKMLIELDRAMNKIFGVYLGVEFLEDLDADILNKAYTRYVLGRME